MRGATGNGLEALPVAELREKGRVLGVVPVGTDRALRQAGPWVEALRAAREPARSTAAVVAAATAATHTTAARASAAVAAVHVVRTSRPRERKPETHGFGGWQQGVRADGRDAVAVAVQQRVVGADGDADGGHDEARLLARGQTSVTTTATGGGSRRRESQGGGRYSTVGGASSKQGGVVEWEAGLKKVEVNERDESE
jgi:hypothetical protein